MFVTPKKVAEPHNGVVYMCQSVQNWSVDVQSESDASTRYEVCFRKLPEHLKDVREEEFDFTCSCPHWERRMWHHAHEYCKHVRRVKALHCGWRQDRDGGELVDGRCPKCGALVVELEEVMKPEEVDDEVEGLLDVEW